MDATYFKGFCMLGYQDNLDGYIQLIRFSGREYFEEIREDLANLIKQGIRLESITTDVHKSILKAIKTALPEVTVKGLFGRYSLHLPELADLIPQTYVRLGATNTCTFAPENQNL